MIDYEGSILAAVEVAYQFHRLDQAKTLAEQSAAFVDLSNAMSDLTSWLPGYHNSTMPWERCDEAHPFVTKYEFSCFTKLKDGLLTEAWTDYWPVQGECPLVDWWAIHQGDYV